MENGQWQTLVPMILFIIAILIMFWAIIVRPTTRRQREHKELIDSLQKGDKIATVGGIYGTIVGVRDTDIDVEVTAGVILTLDRRAVRRRRE